MPPAKTATSIDLSVQLGRLRLPNPILVASGTFGYAREMAGLVDVSRLGGILPKTITQEPRAGNAPWRTIETAAGMLNSIGLDNDGIEAFVAHHLPYLGGLGVPIIVSIAGRTHDEFVAMTRAARRPGRHRGGRAQHLLPERVGRRRFRHRSGDVRAARRRLPRGDGDADHRQADAERDQHPGDRQGGRGRRRRRDFADQHLPGHGDRLAAPPADAGQRAWAA